MSVYVFFLFLLLKPKRLKGLTCFGEVNTTAIQWKSTVLYHVFMFLFILTIFMDESVSLVRCARLCCWKCLYLE